MIPIPPPRFFIRSQIYSIAVSTAIALLVLGCLPRSTPRSDLRESEDLSNLGHLDSRLQDQPLFALNPQKESEYAQAVGRFAEAYSKDFKKHQKMREFLGAPLSSCALRVTIRSININLKGKTSEDQDIENPESWTGIDNKGHFMGLFLSHIDGFLATKQSDYILFSQPFSYPISHSNARIQDIEKIKIVQVGSKYFKGKPWILQSLQLWANHDLIFEKGDLNYRFDENQRELLISLSEIHSNSAYQKLLLKKDCSSS